MWDISFSDTIGKPQTYSLTARTLARILNPDTASRRRRTVAVWGGRGTLRKEQQR